MQTRTCAIPLLWILVALCKHISADDPLGYSIEEESVGTIANIKDDAGFADRYSADELDELYFQFRSTGSQYSNFEIGRDSGVLRVVSAIDRDELCAYQESCSISLDIKVLPPSYFEIVKVKVTIEDINDSDPYFPRDSIQLDISENTAKGAPIYQIPAAEDADSGINGVQSYLLQRLDDDSNMDKFGLRVSDQPDGSKDVRLLLNEELDREEEDKYTMKVVAVDGGSPAKSASVIINVVVTDDNDNSPRFLNSSYEVVIHENIAIGHPILTVEAYDPDLGENGQVVYSFAEHTETAHGDVFGIRSESGEIYVKGEVDFEKASKYSLTAIASDMGPNSLPAFTKVLIHVLDVNDEAPVIMVNALTDSGIAQVTEHALANTFVAYVSVTDGDSGPSGEFDCAIDSSLFKLDERSESDFKILAAVEFDREVASEYQVAMSCTDHGTPPMSTTEQIKVQVTDINDHAPVLSANNFVVAFKENNTMDAVIIQINATDRDAGKNAAIKYSIQGIDNTTDDSVYINPITGVVTAQMIFDYEKENVYKYLISVTDQGDTPFSASASMTLTIQDINDEWPRFSQLIYAFDVSENQDPNTLVGIVNATDDDNYPYDQIRYTIIPGAAYTDCFDVDTFSGALITTRQLDREERAGYTFQVAASNAGFPSIRTVVNISVQVSDINDHKPVIRFPTLLNHSVQMPHKVWSGYQVTRVLASDPDDGSNSVITYSIANGNDLGVFRIDRKTGAIEVNKPEELQDHQTFRMIVAVSDNGQPPLSTHADMSIYVNKSLGALGASSQNGLLEGSNLIILIGVACGVLFIAFIIVIAVMCVRSHKRHLAQKHKYNCRLQEQNKGKLPNGGRTGSASSETPMNDDDHGTVENGHLGRKTKDKTKKEVTFSLDKDEAGWPLHAEPKVIENPHAHSPEYPLPVHDGANRSRGPPGSGDGADSSNGSAKDDVLHHHHHHHHHHYCNRHRKAMTYGSERPLHHLTQGDLEMHDMLNSSMDHESECSCSGSITDSGHGPSEEGDQGNIYAYHQHPPTDPYGYPADPRNVYDNRMADTIYEETSEMCVDGPNTNECPEPQYTAPPPGVSNRPALRYCGNGSRSSVDNCSRGCSPGNKYRYPPRASSNDHVHHQPFNRCVGCTPGSRSSIESVNSAPGRMDNADIAPHGCSLLDPMRRIVDGSNESLVSGVMPLDCEEAAPKMQVSPTGLQRHHSDCVHSTRPVSHGHRAKPSKPQQRFTPPPQWNNNMGDYSNSEAIHTPPTMYRDHRHPSRRMDEGSAGVPSDDDTTVSGSYMIDTAAMQHKRSQLPYAAAAEDGTVV